jgi:hypothetical protein
MPLPQPLHVTNPLARPKPRDRRSSPRHRPSRRISCLIHAGGPPLSATVQDLSARGVALIVAQWFESGAVVTVRLFNEAATFSLDAKLRVTRRCTLPNGDYFIAGELDRTLEPAELRPFLL